MAKRLISTVVGIIILLLVTLSNNMFVFNLALTIIALIGLYEFYNAFKKKNVKAMSLLGYLVTLGILFINGNYDKVKNILILIVPVLILVAFIKEVFFNSKNNIQDVIVTIFGVLYIPFFLMFITLTRQLEYGKYLVWFIFAGAWVTDSFAYLIGRKIGKHKFTKISPNKSIEGAISGIIATSIFFGIYTYYLITEFGLDLSYFGMALFGAVISIIAQIGDLAASSIKRYCEIKDFGTIMPGHGGVLDRFDSIILIAPFIYVFLQICL